MPAGLAYAKFARIKCAAAAQRLRSRSLSLPGSCERRYDLCRCAHSQKPKGAPRRPRPVQDEWGLFDPDQAGLKAVQAALEEIEEPDIFRNVSKPPKSRS